jgi:hypothetical protein
MASGQAFAHRALILKLAAQYRLPAMYFERSFVASGGLVSYGADNVEQFRRAAGDVDRILKGEKPADLLVLMAVHLRKRGQPADHSPPRAVLTPRAVNARATPRSD